MSRDEGEPKLSSTHKGECRDDVRTSIPVKVFCKTARSIYWGMNKVLDECWSITSRVQLTDTFEYSGYSLPCLASTLPKPPKERTRLYAAVQEVCPEYESKRKDMMSAIYSGASASPYDKDDRRRRGNCRRDETRHRRHRLKRRRYPPSSIFGHPRVRGSND